MKKSAKAVKSKPAPKAAKPASKPSVSLEHCLMARIKYVGWIQALQTDVEFQNVCIPKAERWAIPNALIAAYLLLEEHDKQAKRWYPDYSPSPKIAPERGSNNIPYFVN